MRTTIVLTLVLLFCSTAFANDRISELRDEAGMLQERLAQYQQAIQNIQIRLIEINGAIKELRTPEGEENEKDKLEETIPTNPS